MSRSRGQAVITGAAGVVFTAGVVSLAGAGHNQSLSQTREADHDLLKDGLGDAVMDFITSMRRTVSASVVPYDPTSMADAIAATGDFLPEPGDKVVLTDTADVYTGTYLVMSSKENRTNTSHNVIDLELTTWQVGENPHDLTLIPGA